MGRSRPVATLTPRSAETPATSTTIGGARIIEPEYDRAVGVRDTSARPSLFPIRWPWARRTAQVVQPLSESREPSSSSTRTNPRSSIRLETIETVSVDRFDEGYDQEIRAVSAGTLEPPDWVNGRRRDQARPQPPAEPRDDIFKPDITPWDRFRDGLARPFHTLNQLNPLRQGR